jgi:hypothetical protein
MLQMWTWPTPPSLFEAAVLVDINIGWCCCCLAPAADVDIAYTTKPLWESYIRYIEDGGADGAIGQESSGGGKRPRGLLHCTAAGTCEGFRVALGVAALHCRRDVSRQRPQKGARALGVTALHCRRVAALGRGQERPWGLLHCTVAGACAGSAQWLLACLLAEGCKAQPALPQRL